MRDAEERQAPAKQRVAVSTPTAQPIKVAILGAGSAVFARQLMTDLLCTPGLEQGVFALVDIDTERLDLAQAVRPNHNREDSAIHSRSKS